MKNTTKKTLRTIENTEPVGQALRQTHRDKTPVPHRTAPERHPRHPIQAAPAGAIKTA